MGIKFYHNVGDTVTLNESTTLWGAKKLQAGSKYSVRTLEFSNELAHYTLDGCGDVKFHDCDFERGRELKVFDEETHTISIQTKENK